MTTVALLCIGFRGPQVIRRINKVKSLLPFFSFNGQMENVEISQESSGEGMGNDV